jgi:hypothetical protein
MSIVKLIYLLICLVPISIGAFVCILLTPFAILPWTRPIFWGPYRLYAQAAVRMTGIVKPAT